MAVGGQRVAGSALLVQQVAQQAGRVGEIAGDVGMFLEVDGGAKRFLSQREIALAFGDPRPGLGGGLAGHNGLKSMKAGLGPADFGRLRIGVSRPDSTDPEIVSAWVLGRFSEPPAEVSKLVSDSADLVEAIVDGRIELEPGGQRKR